MTPDPAPIIAHDASCPYCARAVRNVDPECPERKQAVAEFRRSLRGGQDSSSDEGEADAGGPAELVVAYCAPGLKNYATRILEANGERVREVIEHPYMTGRTDIILTTDPDWPRRH